MGETGLDFYYNHSKKKNQISRNRIANNSKEYDYLFDEVNKRLFERLSIIKRKFNNVLELGSRTGNTINFFNTRKDIKNLLITDLSKDMLLQAKQKNFRYKIWKKS